MGNVTIVFNGKEYLLSCDDGQEDNLKELASFLDAKFQKLKIELGNIGENKLLLISTIKIIDDYFDLKKKIESKKNEFENITSKFRELKSLAINYKDEKEKEIDSLKLQMNEFQNMVEESKKNYEEILDKTAKSIEEFIETTQTNRNN